MSLMMTDDVPEAEDFRLTVTQRARLEMLSHGVTRYDYTYIQPGRDFRAMEELGLVINSVEDEWSRFRMARITQQGLIFLGQHKRIRLRRRRRMR